MNRGFGSPFQGMTRASFASHGGWVDERAHMESYPPEPQKSFDSEWVYRDGVLLRKDFAVLPDGRALWLKCNYPECVRSPYAGEFLWALKTVNNHTLQIISNSILHIFNVIYIQNFRAIETSKVMNRLLLPLLLLPIRTRQSLRTKFRIEISHPARCTRRSCLPEGHLACLRTRMSRKR